MTLLTISTFLNTSKCISWLIHYLSDARDACGAEQMATETMMDIVQWLLAKNIIQQQHTYVYFMCPESGAITSQNLDPLPGSHDNNRKGFNNGTLCTREN